MIEEIRKEIEEKIHRLERNNHPRSLELIEWLNSLLKKIEEQPKPVKNITVEIPGDEYVTDEPKTLSSSIKEKAPKRKIVFKKK